jgi:gamma-glutamyltranspeptidase
LPHLAASLEAIASGGPDVVYMGELAERIIEYSSTLGGWLTHDDLRKHRGEWTDPISTRHRHIELLECLPNGQGIAALGPAIDLARQGFPVPKEVASSWERGARTLVEPEPESGLLIGGRAPRAGEIARLPHVAASLEAIASGGPDVVYSGELADRIIEYSSSLGGWLTHDDLREHRGEWTDPISTRYRHIELLECPPNGQGIAALVAAAILDGFDPFGVVGTPEWTHLVVEATKLGLGDAFATVGADDGGEAALACLDPHRIADVRSGIDPLAPSFRCRSCRWVRPGTLRTLPLSTNTATAHR